MLDIVLNGEQQEVEEGTSVTKLLAQLGFGMDYLVVEQNCVIVPRDAFDSTMLQADDRVEVISFIGGGGGRESDES